MKTIWNRLGVFEKRIIAISILLTAASVIIANFQQAQSYADCAMASKVISIETTPENFKILHGPLLKSDSINSYLLTQLLDRVDRIYYISKIGKSSKQIDQALHERDVDITNGRLSRCGEDR
ncbi:MAG TPA: hypothetical protein VIJ25_08280 [Methylococcales bacterium]